MFIDTLREVALCSGRQIPSGRLFESYRRGSNRGSVTAVPRSVDGVPSFLRDERHES
jgi:hypothetical protein